MVKFGYRIQKDPFGAHCKLVEWVGNEMKVLDVGCASGYLAKELVKKKCSVTGVEIDAVAAKGAKKFCERVIVGDVEEMNTFAKIDLASYDVVLLADVIEHLANPEKVLDFLSKHIDRDCEVIISIPNIAFLTYRLLHLFGKFEYEENGIMDKTHLRFFSRKTIEKLLENSGFVILGFDCVGNFTQLPLYMQTLYPLVGKKNWMRKLEQMITRLWSQGLAVQFLYRCKII